MCMVVTCGVDGAAGAEFGGSRPWEYDQWGRVRSAKKRRGELGLEWGGIWWDVFSIKGPLQQLQEILIYVT